MIIAIVLSGGVGTRIESAVPKQYIEIGNKPVIAYVLEMIDGYSPIEKLQVVAEKAWHDEIKKYAGNKLVGFSEPGENRQLSIWNGLKDTMDYALKEDIVIIFDAARPVIKPDMLDRLVEAMADHDAATPVLPMKDTVYICNDGRFTDTAQRESLFAGQAPEAFRLGLYYDAVKSLLPEKIRSTTGSLQMALLAGMDAVPVAGDENNFKITTAADLERFERMITENCR